MASTYLSKTFGTATGTQKLTFSVWVKRSRTATSEAIIQQNADYFFFNGDAIDFETSIGRLKTNRLFRDCSAWYHIVITADTTLATADDRLKMYINGVQETSFAARTNPTQNANFAGFNSANEHIIGRRQAAPANDLYFDGSMTHFHFIDGTAYTASTFGSFDSNGVWKPKTSPSVTYGTNGFFLKFENSGSMGTDSSPNGNNFTVNGTLTQTVDTPSNVYATLNALDGVASTMGLQNGNTKLNGNSASDWKAIGSTLAVNTGKFYWESKILGTGNSAVEMRQGVCDISQIPQITGNKFTSQSRGIGLTPSGYYTIADVSTNYGTTYTTNDILSFALDLDNGAFYIAKNGTWMNSGDPTSGASKTGAISVTTGYFYTPATEHYASTNIGTAYNFGNGYFGTTAVSSAGSNGNGSIFEYDVPTGYYALNTKNLATYG